MTFKKIDLRKQRGMLLCDGCFDTVLEIEPVNVKWQSPRDNSTSLTAVTSPTVYTLSTGSISFVGRSQTNTREGSKNEYEMQVIGATDLVVIDSIAGMPDGTHLVLKGTSDTLRVAVRNSPTIYLMGKSVVLWDGSTLELVYSVALGQWRESSRFGTTQYAVPLNYNVDLSYTVNYLSYTGMEL
jgi:hypothetical protein